MEIHAYHCPQQGSALQPFTYATEPLGPHQILVEITHFGICHSDLHLIDNYWNFSHYPLVPGHEIIGFVR